MFWNKGRLGTGYDKRRLFQVWRPLPCDAWLLRFPPGSAAPRHIDPVPGHRHYRCNLILRKAGRGGDFLADHPIIDLPRLKLFRSDLPHEVTRIESGVRYVLSFGVCVPI